MNVDLLLLRQVLHHCQFQLVGLMSIDSHLLEAVALDVDLLLFGGVLYHRSTAGELLAKQLGRLPQLHAEAVQAEHRCNTLPLVPCVLVDDDLS